MRCVCVSVCVWKSFGCHERLGSHINLFLDKVGYWNVSRRKIMLLILWVYYNEEEDFSETSTAKGSCNSITTQVISNQSKKRYHQICSCVLLTTTVLFCVHPQMKATLSLVLIKGSLLPPGSTLVWVRSISALITRLDSLIEGEL